MKNPLKNQQGFTLILALSLMLVMAVTGVSVIMNMNADVGIARNDRSSKLAFQLAEAGLNEAMSRLRLPSVNANYIGELVADANYRTTNWNLNNANGKNFGKNGGAGRTSMNNFNYSVSIRYLDESNGDGFCDGNDAADGENEDDAGLLVPPAPCDVDPAEVVMYGQDFNLDATITSKVFGKVPVYLIRSTATYEQGPESTTRTIEAYVGATNLDLDVGHAIITNQCIDNSGVAHTITGTVMYNDTGGCTCPPGVADPDADYCIESPDEPVINMNTYLGMPLADVIDIADEKYTNADIPASGMIDDMVQDWGDPLGDTYGTIIYVDNDAPGDKDAQISGNNFQGRGLLIVTGDLVLSGTVHYEGLIYVLGSCTISGNNSKDVDGALICNAGVTLNGSVDVTFNPDNLTDIGREKGGKAMVVWRRL